MNYRKTDIAQFLELAHEAGSCVIDVRSESEFASGHFPGAMSLPLLNDAERHEVGICYKEKGNEAAVELGFRLVGPRFADLILEAKTKARGKHLLIYCWRGGSRSNIAAWLLSTAGFQVTLLLGGYKAWRSECLILFQSGPPLRILGGATGVGKTELLQEAQSRGQFCLHLEQLAQHKGSAFGGLWRAQEKTQEQFENDLAMALWHCKSASRIWVEDESRFVGRIRIPDGLFARMVSEPMYLIERPIELRAQRVLSEYGVFDKEVLAEKTRALAKRMGGEQVANAIACLEQEDWFGWIYPLLAYYDKTYRHSIARRNQQIEKVILWEHDSVEQVLKEMINE